FESWVSKRAWAWEATSYVARNATTVTRPRTVSVVRGFPRRSVQANAIGGASGPAGVTGRGAAGGDSGAFSLTQALVRRVAGTASARPRLERGARASGWGASTGSARRLAAVRLDVEEARVAGERR